MDFLIDICFRHGVCRLPEAVQYLLVHPVYLIVAHCRAFSPIFVAKFCHIPEFMFNFALVQHIEQERNNPREGYLPSTWWVIALTLLFMLDTSNKNTLGAFLFPPKPRKKRKILQTAVINRIGIHLHESYTLIFNSFKYT